MNDYIFKVAQIDFKDVFNLLAMEWNKYQINNKRFAKYNVY